MPILVITNLFDHADGEAFLKTAKLTSVASAFVNRTIAIGQTDVFGTLLNRSFKKAFTTFTRPHAVMLTGGIITANSAQLRRRLGLMLLLLMMGLTSTGSR
jgi:hypothetical protein